MAVGSPAPAKPCLPNCGSFGERTIKDALGAFDKSALRRRQTASLDWYAAGATDRPGRSRCLPPSSCVVATPAGSTAPGVNPDATKSMAGMPRGRGLYGSIPDRLADDASFARQLQAILRVRSHYGIATSRQIDIPDSQQAADHHSGLPAPISAAVAASRRVAEGVRDAAVESGEAAWVNRCRSSPRCSYISLKNTFTSSSRGRRH